MSYKSCLSCLLLIFAVLYVGAGEAHACSCGPTPTVLEAYEGAGFVVITRIVSVEKAVPEKDDVEHYVDGVKSTRMIIERVFKGNMKVGDELIFGQGGGADCIFTFSEESIGQQLLFYLSSRERNPAIWYGFGCGRSGGLESAHDDLLYLNKLERVRGKTRLSGTVGVEGHDGAASLEGRRIRITGAAGKIYEVKTDKHGVYEIYDLPAGQYVVEPDIAAGWKLSDYYLGRSKSVVYERDGKAGRKVNIIIEAKKHAALNLRFEIDNALRGKVYDPGGKLLSGVCVELVPAEENTSKQFYQGDCTEEAGTFEITEIPSGSYLLVVNRGGKISSREPFKTFYYPDVFERERATIINVGAGDMLEVDIRAPHVEPVVTVEGVFLYSDGKPVANATVIFRTGKKEDTTADNAQDAGKNTTDPDARTQTDAKGRFALRILKGLEGEIFGIMMTFAGEFADCPKLDAIIKKTERVLVTVETEAVKVRATNDIKQVEVKFPFPGCKPAKPKEGAK